MKLVNLGWAVPVAIVVPWVIYRTAFRRADNAPRGVDPGVAEASPKIATSMRIDLRPGDSASGTPSYYLVPVIHNEGQLPAKDLKGRCRVFSPVHKSQERIVAISQEILDASTLEIDGGRLDGFLIDADHPQNALFHVALDLEFRGFPTSTPRRYSARYAFDQKSLQMIKVHEQK